MDKVLVERPRGGWRINKNRARRRKWRDDPDHAATRESVRAGRRTKWLSENLSPLERFLVCRVGGNWDRIYAEICARIDPSNPIQLHILQHLWDFVSYEDAHHPWRRPRFYVCPRSNRLLERKTTYTKPANVGARRIRLGSTRYLRKIDGHWHEITLTRRGDGPPGTIVDALLGPLHDLLRDGRRIDNALRKLHGSALVYASDARPLTDRELEQLRRERKKRRG